MYVHCLYTKNEERNYNIESDFISMDAEISDIFFSLSFICFVLVIISVRTPNISQSGSMVGGVRAFRRQNRYVNSEHKRMLLLFFCFSLFIFICVFRCPFLCFYFILAFCLYIIWMNNEHYTCEQWTMYVYMVSMHIEFLKSKWNWKLLKMHSKFEIQNWSCWWILD